MIDIREIEKEIKKREEALIRVKYKLSNTSDQSLLPQEEYLLEDQLYMYRVVLGLLRDDQPKYDEMLKTV